MKQVGIKAIRNVAFVGHGGSGKTSLTEALLFITGGIDRMGKVEDGNTVSDFDADEVKRKISINASVVPVEWKEHKINIIDAPGYLDFIGDMVGALHVADAAVLVTPAQSAPEVGFDIALEYIEKRGIARAVFISKMDRENADFEARLKELRERFGARVVPVIIPIGAEATFEGVVNLISMRAVRGTGAKATEDDVPASMQQQVSRYHEWLEESAAEGDDELTLKYLEGEPLTSEEIQRGLKAGIASGKLIPVMCGSASNLNGLTAFLDFIIGEFPSPADIPPVKGINPQTGQEETRRPDDSEPLAAFVFKTMADPYVGKLTYFRVMSGLLRSDSHVWNANKEREERVGQIFFLRGKQQEPTPAVHAGDIGAIAKLQETSTGDTLTDRAKPILLPGIEFPSPVYSIAIRAKSKADEDRLGPALSRLAEEDPTFRFYRDPETGQTVISGMGESHLDVVIERMKRKFGTEVTTEELRIPYRETIRSKAQAQGKHKKQTGGRGQYGDCWIEIEPYPDGEFLFEDRIVGGVIPKQYIPAVEKGVRDAMRRGVLAGYPVVNVKCAVYDGSYHTVDSSDQAFQIAGSLAFQNAAAKANMVLLEPVLKVEIIVPEEFLGDVISDLNGKRGRVMGTESAGTGRQKITALVPQAEMVRYAIDLRSITRGRGRFSTEFSHYDEVPAHIAQQIIERARKERAEAEK